MLASIRATGGVGGGALKKVSDKDKRDRSAAAVPGTEPSAPVGGAPPAPPGGGGLGDALAAALNKRNKKVSASGMLPHQILVALDSSLTKLIDDEDDDDDDWDSDPKPKRR